jgi:N-acetylglucosamine-6-phosphate deacetylase
LIVGNQIVDEGCIIIRDKKILYAGPSRSAPATPEGAEVIDTGGLFASAGFVDLHVHGAMGSDFMDATLEDFGIICQYHAAGGTTSLLATTASAPREQIVQALATVRQAKKSLSGGAQVLGAHVEGPYFAVSKRGCHREREVRLPLEKDWQRILEFSDSICSMTLAPELPSAEPLIRTMAGRGILVCCGHSAATYEGAMRAVQWGARHVTHLFCAMSSIVRQEAHRSGGLLEAALLCDELTAEVIADGKHLPPELIRLALKCKGGERLCAVTDAMRGAGMPDGQYAFGPADGELANVRNGEAKTLDGSGFASSVVQMKDLLRVLVREVGLSIPQSVAMLTETPAHILRIENTKGSLKPGADADVVLWDDCFEVQKTFVQGELVYEKP